MAFFCVYFKGLNCYIFPNTRSFCRLICNTN